MSMLLPLTMAIAALPAVSDAAGVLRLSLRAGGYDWSFRPIAGGTFRDSGSASWH